MSSLPPKGKPACAQCSLISYDWSQRFHREDLVWCSIKCLNAFNKFKNEERRLKREAEKKFKEEQEKAEKERKRKEAEESKKFRVKHGIGRVSHRPADMNPFGGFGGGGPPAAF